MASVSDTALNHHSLTPPMAGLIEILYVDALLLCPTKVVGGVGWGVVGWRWGLVGVVDCRLYA